jgi:hypothetical protein
MLTLLIAIGALLIAVVGRLVVGSSIHGRPQAAAGCAPGLSRLTLGAPPVSTVKGKLAGWPCCRTAIFGGLDPPMRNQGLCGKLVQSVPPRAERLHRQPRLD